MALPNLIVPDYPNVPRLPGVPALIRKVGAPLAAIGLITTVSDEITRLINGPTEQVWGVFDAKGNDALSADTFLGIEFRNSSRLIDYPIESGAFASYNKVANPFSSSIIMAKGGTSADRAAFLVAVDALVATLDLYSIVTPEATYLNVNLEGYEYHKERVNGANMAVVNLQFREIRTNAIVNGQAPTKSVSAAPVKSVGQVTANPVTVAQMSAITALGFAP